MAQQQISDLVNPKLDKELTSLIGRLQQVQVSFKPIMTQVQDTFKAMGGSARDVRTLLKAVDDYNKIMGTGATVAREYNAVQTQIAALRKRITDGDQAALITLERLKAANAANNAVAKQTITVEAAVEERTRRAGQTIRNNTTTMIDAREQTRRLVLEMKRHIDVVNGTININGKEQMTYRAKSALLAQMRERFKDVSTEVGKNLIPQINRLDKELKKIDRSMGIGTRTVGLYENFKGMGSALGQAIPALSQFLTLGAAGGGILAVAAGIKAYYDAVKYGIKVNREFEQSTANLASIMGVTRKETALLQEQALQLGRTTEYTATQVVGAQTELLKLGFGQQTILNMTKPLLGFATALDASLPQAAAVAGQALRAFNRPSSETEKVLTEMTLAANLSAMDFAYLERSIAIVGASASVAKVPLKDTLALLGVLSNSGLDASRAATALRNVFLYLADDSKKLGKEMKGTNMDAASISKGFTELRKKGVDLADMFQLTDKRAVNALAVLIQNSEQIIKLRDGIRSTTGALDEMRQTRLDTLEGDIKLLTAAWDTYWLSFRENMPLYRQFIQWTTDLLNNQTSAREKYNYTQEAGTSYAQNKVDKAAVKAATGEAEARLSVLGDMYKKALDNKDDTEANKIYKQILDTRTSLLEKYTKDYVKTADDLKTVSDRVGNAIAEAFTGTQGERGDIYKVARENALNFGRAQQNILLYTKGITAQNQVQLTLESRLEKVQSAKDKLPIERQLEESRKKTEEYKKGIQSALQTKQDVYNLFDRLGAQRMGGKGGLVTERDGLDRIINTFKKARNTDANAQGRFLTAGQSKDAVADYISESERTFLQGSTGDFQMQSDKKSKEQIAADARAKKEKDLRDAEELAAFNRKIATSKTNAAEAEAIAADNDIKNYDLRRAAVDSYVISLTNVEENEYARKDKKLRQDVQDSLGYTDKVLDPNVIDPVTGQAQTEIEKATLEQRLALWEEFDTNKTEVQLRGVKDRAKIDDQQVKDEEANVEKGLAAFKDGLEKRLKEVQDSGEKIKLQAAKLFNDGQWNDTQLKDENAKTDVIIAEQMAAQTKLYYEDFINKTGLPEALKAKLIAVYDEEVKALATKITSANVDYETQTGKNYQRISKKTLGSKLRSLFKPEAKRDANGNIDVAAETDASKTAGSKLSGIINSEEVQIGVDSFSRLTSVMSSYYDEQAARVEQAMAQEALMYEQKKTLLDENLAHLEMNNEAGLLSEENYKAQKRKNAIEQRSLDKKHHAEQQAMEKQKRQLQVKAAKWEKAQNVSSAIMSTATGIAASLKLGAPLGPIFAAIVGALGAAQVALIVGQQIPQYAKGTLDHKGGLMEVGDGGKHEFVMTPSGQVTKTDNKSTLMYAPKHTKVFKDEETYLSYLRTHSDSYIDKGIDVHVNSNDPEQRKLLRNIDGGIGRLNANERYRLKLERNNLYNSQW